MRRTLTVLAMAAVMVMAMASMALAAPNGNGAGGVGACWGSAISEARSSGMATHDNYAGGLNAFLEIGHPIPAICDL